MCSSSVFISIAVWQPIAWIHHTPILVFQFLTIISNRNLLVHIPTSGIAVPSSTLVEIIKWFHKVVVPVYTPIGNVWGFSYGRKVFTPQKLATSTNQSFFLREPFVRSLPAYHCQNPLSQTRHMLSNAWESQSFFPLRRNDKKKNLIKILIEYILNSDVRI